MSMAAQILDNSKTVDAPSEVTSSPQTEQTGAPSNPSLDMIAKMERKNKLMEQDWRAKQSEYEQIKKWKEEHEGVFSQLEKDPLAVLKGKGWDLERINKHALDTMSDDDLDPVARRIKQLEESTASMQERIAAAVAEAVGAKEQEYAKKDESRQIEVYKSQLKAHLAQNKDKYELINAEESGMDAVYDVIWEDLQRRKESHDPSQPFVPMTFDEAAEKVENYLDKQFDKYASLNKVKKRFQGEGVDWSSQLTKSEPQTITSRHTAQSNINPAELSEKERIQAAVEGIKSGRWNNQ